MKNYLRSIPLFEDLAEDDLSKMCMTAVEVHLVAGEELFAEGSIGDRAYVIKEGALGIYKRSGDRDILLDVHGKGAVIGEMALLEQRPRSASVRARQDSVLISINQNNFEQMINTSANASRQIMDIILRRMRETEAKLQQSKQMAQLNTLTAGVAHELNNPAAAVKRSASLLRDSLESLVTAQTALSAANAMSEHPKLIEQLQQRIDKSIGHPSNLDPLELSDHEAALEDWLDSRGFETPWEYASQLVDLGFTVSELDGLFAELPPDKTLLITKWLTATYTSNSLLTEIVEGAAQISEIIKALRTYSYLDRADVLNIDVHEGLDSTLVIFRHRLKDRITVHREYDPDLPIVQAHGRELNQVWTNVIRNAIDALEDQPDATITIRTRYLGEEDMVEVEIEDNGPGIPEKALPSIFDAFFTTKEPGKGTGMGLHVSYSIVTQHHHGDMKVHSQPGQTRFIIQLPVTLDTPNEE
jgi:signal transduction histidine kinase